MLGKLIKVCLIYGIFTLLFTNMSTLRSGDVNAILTEQKADVREFILDDLIPYVDAKVEPYKDDDRTLFTYLLESERSLDEKRNFD